MSEVLKSFRQRYRLTQLSAAKWMLLAPGTYRDYEQGRSDPIKIVAYALHNRIRDYEIAYTAYLAKRNAARERARQAAAAQPALASN